MKHKTLCFAAFLVFLFPSPASDHMPLVVAFRLEGSAPERAVFAKINAYRARKGLNELRWDNRVAAQARAHSQAMAKGQRAFGHGGFEERIKATGIQFTSAAENVGENQGFADPAEKAVDGWLHSHGHRTNIEGDYNLTGVGVVRRRDGAYFFTQIFMRARRGGDGR